MFQSWPHCRKIIIDVYSVLLLRQWKSATWNLRETCKICRHNSFLNLTRGGGALSVESFKGTLEWEFFWLRFWILSYFIVSYAKIIRFWGKNFWIGPSWGELRFFRVVLRLRGMKKFFELGQKNIFFFFIYKPFTWANTSFSEIRSINCARNGLMCQSWAKMSKFIPLSLRLSGIEFSLVWD